MRKSKLRVSSTRAISLIAAAAAVSVTAVPIGHATETGTVAATVAHSRLNVDWTASPGTEAYLVVDERTGEVLQRSDATEFSTAMTAPGSRALLLFADVGDSARLLGKVQAMAPGSDSGLPSAVAVATPEDTTLRWQDLTGVTSWSITNADGDRLKTVTSNTVSVPGTLGSANLEYKIVGQRVVDDTPTEVISGFDLSNVVYNAEDVDGDAQAGDVIAAGVYPIVTSRVPYETYIPYQYINAPDTGSPFDCESGDGSDYWYSGDNRGVAYESGKYRTRGLASYWWTDRTTFTTKVVSPTKRYKKTSSGYVYDSQRTASSDGFVMRPVTNDGRSALTQINHSVGQPYCSAMNNIDYDIRQEMYQSGGHYFLGRHDQMPNHQLYRFDIRSDGSTQLDLVFHHKLVDPKCLNWLFPCAQRQYQYSR